MEPRPTSRLATSSRGRSRASAGCATPSRRHRRPEPDAGKIQSPQPAAGRPNLKACKGEQRVARATAWLAAAVLGAMAGTLAGSASAQVPEMRFARQFSMGYLQFNIMEQHHLREK